jgi:hypothetical protein
MARPSFPFTVKWWLKEKSILSLSTRERGLLLELMILMMRGDEYGVAIKDGLLYTIEAISMATGLDINDIKEDLPALQEKKLIVINEKNALSCPYMIQDMNLRTMRQEIGSKGGNPSLKKEPEEDVYVTAKGRNLTGRQLQAFNIFWKHFNYFKDKAHAADSWLNLEVKDPDLFDQIIAGAKREAERRPRLIEMGRTPKMAQGWLTARRWEDRDG